MKKSNFKYEVASDDLQKGCFAYLALQSKLFVDNWGFKKWLNKMTSGDFSYEIGLCFYRDIPVGCSIIKQDGHIGFYVKDGYRHRGIGTKLCEVMRSATQQEYLYAGLGQGGSDKFFEWVDIPIDEMY